MLAQQPIVTPFGVSVFGSAIVRVLPDIAVLSLSVSRLKLHPKEAFQDVREAAQQVQAYLSSVKIKDAGSSHISLSEEFHYAVGEQKFAGYRTRVQFRVVMSDLTRVEEILTGVIDAGINKINSVDFQTTRLKEIRAEARRQAINAAHEKAEIYCKAAGVNLGEVIHIEDLNPDQLQRPIVHSSRQEVISLADEGEVQAFDPSSIVVAGAVMVAYKIQGQ
jgi:uncharacterized protein